MLKDKPELKVIVVDGEVIKYYLERKTTLYSKIRYKDGIITVVIPTFLKDNELESFVSKHIGKFAKRIEKKNETELININDNKIALFGIPYTIKIIKGAKNKYELLGKKLYLTLTNDSKKKEVIKNFLKDNSCDWITKRFKYWSNIMDIHNIKLEFKWLTGVWGVCDHFNKKITIAYITGVNKKELIDYVIVHELSHIKVHNHSKKFWDYVDKYIPNSKKVRKQINVA